MRAIIDGYYNQNDGKFYSDSEYTTEISGNVNNLYHDISTDNLYEWTGSAFAVTWINPKTDWKIQYDAAGAFLGDFINIADYNRIKNNVAYILSIAPQVAIDNYPTMGADKTSYTEYPRAGEWNAIENALHQLAANIGGNFIAAEYMENGFTPNYQELNRIESYSLRLKIQYEAAAAMKFRLPFTLGQQSNDIRV